MKRKRNYRTSPAIYCLWCRCALMLIAFGGCFLGITPVESGGGCEHCRGLKE